MPRQGWGTAGGELLDPGAVGRAVLGRTVLGLKGPFILYPCVQPKIMGNAQPQGRGLLIDVYRRCPAKDVGHAQLSWERVSRCQRFHPPERDG